MYFMNVDFPEPALPVIQKKSIVGPKPLSKGGFYTERTIVEYPLEGLIIQGFDI